ncbi:hypothetical protein [Endozoicomonas euniceicola]|uniref:Uncharacterized protein n=1 Tax=Endozoicomonas euniceicola TaxID=1234143 RepID=A0ABY6GSH6_9GAMM|nr:hypothetical protein [Endozoicomonas euniceicola]UYM15712.1 hypothetical protein NX720_23260 [Endozoicomonas euniceicola]
MKNSFIANSVNTTVQKLLGKHNILGTSLNIYSQKSFFMDHVGENIKQNAAYPRLKKASSFLYTSRKFCELRNHNDYETGRILFNHCMNPFLAKEGIAANAHECSALTIFSALSSTDLIQVNRAIVTTPGNNPSGKILHEFVIIGEVTGNKTCVVMRMNDIAHFLAKNLLPRSERPWVVDAAINIVCPLTQYIEQLGLAISSVNLAADKEQTDGLHPLHIGPEITPMGFYGLISGGYLLAIEVTPKSTRLNISESKGELNYNDFF